MRTRPIEMYYGYYLGDLKVWDTCFVFIPADTPENQIEPTALAVARPEFEQAVAVDIAFFGMYSIPEPKDEPENEETTS